MNISEFLNLVEIDTGDLTEDQYASFAATVDDLFEPESIKEWVNRPNTALKRETPKQFLVYIHKLEDLVCAHF